MRLSTLLFVCASLREAACLIRNIKPGSDNLSSNLNETMTPRDLFVRQSCDPGYGLCDSGYCCPSDSQCCGSGCAPGNSVCCGDSGNCPSGNSCCTYNCAPSGWGCCDSGYSAPLDADCCADGGYCPSGTYCVDCDDGSVEGCCNSPYSVSSYYYSYTSSVYFPEVSSYSHPSYSDDGSYSSYIGGVGEYSYYYTWFTWSWYIYWRTVETVTSTYTTTSTQISVYASDTYDAQEQFTSLENSFQSIAADNQITFSANPFPSATASGAPSPGAAVRGHSPLWAAGNTVGACFLVFAVMTGVVAVAL